MQPYTQLAPQYDELIGKPFLPGLCSAFERLVRGYRIRFRRAADLGCGTGLFARYLRRRWRVPVYGVDNSRAMLRVARSRPCAGVRYLQQDLRALRLPRDVDLITANFDTVNHLLRQADLLSAFRRVAGCLRPGGHFVFDAITPCICRLRQQRIERELPRGRRIRQEIVGCGPDGKVRIDLTARAPHGRRLVVSNIERTYRVRDMLRLLESAGLRVRGVHDASAPGGRSHCPARVLIVTRKPAAVPRGDMAYFADPPGTTAAPRRLPSPREAAEDYMRKRYPPPRNAQEEAERRVQELLKQKPPQPLPKRSLSELVLKRLDEKVDETLLRAGIKSKKWRERIRKAARGAAERGASKALGRALDEAGVKGDYKKAIDAAVRAAVQKPAIR